jgi:stearoyl-CoA desaturase (delta-9 desaturase)
MAEALAHPVPAQRSYSVPATAFYVLLYAGCLGVFWTGVTAQAVALFVASYATRILALSISYHRYFAHRSYRTSRPMQFLLALAGATTLEGGPLWWAQTHREHHRHADTPDDLHSPTYQGFLYSHFGWFLNKQHRETDLSQVPDLAKYPELRWLDRWYLGVAGAYALALTAAFGLTGFVWGFCLSTVAILQATHFVQTVSHMYGGYRRYPTADNSRNLWWFSILAMGEGFHHNHHYQPSSARLGFFWWEFDAGYQFLRALQWLGLVTDLRTPSEAVRGGALAYQRDVRVFRRNVETLRADLARAVERFVADSEGVRIDGATAELRTLVHSRFGVLDARAAQLLVQGPDTLRAAFAGERSRMHQAIVTLAAARPADPAVDALAIAAATAFAEFARRDCTLHWREDRSRPWPRSAA